MPRGKSIATGVEAVVNVSIGGVTAIVVDIEGSVLEVAGMLVFSYRMGRGSPVTLKKELVSHDDSEKRLAFVNQAKDDGRLIGARRAAGPLRLLHGHGTAAVAVVRGVFRGAAME